jgi:hypothetical protein
MIITHIIFVYQLLPPAQYYLTQYLHILFIVCLLMNLLLNCYDPGIIRKKTQKVESVLNKNIHEPLLSQDSNEN